jgi:hypothetical protein
MLSECHIVQRNLSQSGKIVWSFKLTTNLHSDLFLARKLTGGYEFTFLSE